MRWRSSGSSGDVGRARCAFAIGSPLVALGGTLGGALVGGGVGIVLGRTQYGDSNSHWRARGVILHSISVSVIVGISVAFVVSGASAWVFGMFVAIPLVVATSLVLALRDSM